MIKKLLLFGVILIVIFGLVYKYSLSRVERNSVINDQGAANVLVQSTPTPIPTLSPISIILTGDLMFDRHIRQNADKKGNEFIFAEVSPLFTKQDLVIVNLEGPITDNPSRSINSAIGSTNNYIFTFPVSLAKTLNENNIKVVNLGNNHALNFGKDGLAQTLTHLKNNNIQYFGSLGDDSVPRSIILEIKGKKIGFINYNQFAGVPIEQTILDVKNLRPAVDLLIVYPHWGEEYQTTANDVIIGQAHKLIDAGADLIVGHHPHVVQNSEIYKSKEIYYSLGNFIFDQYFETNVQRGLMLQLTILPNSNAIKTQEIPIVLDKSGQTKIGK